jgi:23S rRNA-/tRNA-specific pseudouridylate synthase
MRYERPVAVTNESPRFSAATTGVRQLQVSAEDAGQRIDNFLLRHFKSVPRSRVYRLLRRGEVRVNGRRCKPDYRLIEGDRLRLPPVRTGGERPPARVPPGLIERVRAAIVYEDPDSWSSRNPQVLRSMAAWPRFRRSKRYVRHGRMRL